MYLWVTMVIYNRWLNQGKRCIFLSLESVLLFKKKEQKHRKYRAFFTQQRYIQDIKERKRESETSRDRGCYGLLEGTRAGHTELLLF